MSAFPLISFVEYHEGSKWWSVMISDPSEDLECLRWPTKEVWGAVAWQHNKITFVLGRRAWPKWWISRYFAQGHILLILRHDSQQMFQSLRDCNGSLVMADPYHHAWEYHLRFPRQFYLGAISDMSEKQRLMAQVLVVSLDPVLGILHLPLDDMVQIYHQCQDDGDGTEQFVHVYVEIHVQPAAQPQDFWVFRQPFVSKCCVWIHPALSESVTHKLLGLGNGKGHDGCFAGILWREICFIVWHLQSLQ